MKKIIFLCTGNSCRSQMAHGFANDFLSFEKKIIQSAGVRADGLNEFAVKVMNEVNIDISNYESKTINSIKLSDFDLIVTVCDHARSCVNMNLLQSNRILNYNLEDPVNKSGTFGEKMIVYRKTRDQIKSIVFSIISGYDKFVNDE